MALKGLQTKKSYLDFKQAVEVALKLHRDEDYIFSLYWAISIFTGLRVSDVLNLKWEQVLEAIAENKNLLIREKKTGKMRSIKLHPKLKEIIEMNRQKLLPISGWIVAAKHGYPMSREYINKKLKLTARRYRIETGGYSISSHTLRKTFARKIWDSSNSDNHTLMLLADILNHTSTHTTKTYLGIRKQEIDSAYDLLDV